MRERHLGWLCFVVACAAMALCISTTLLAAQTSSPTDTVNLELKDTDVKSAVEVLFRNTGKNFSIDSNVHGTIGALSIKDVPFDVALKSLAKSAGLVYRLDGGVYIVSMKPDVSMVINSLPPPQVDSLPVDSPTTEPEIRIEKISLNNVGASEILAMLTGSNRDYGGYGLGNGSMGGSRFGGMNSGMGYGSSSFGNNGYGMNSGYGSGYGMNSGYGGGYGMNSGYGNSGYSSGYGNRLNSYGNGSNGGVPPSIGGYGTTGPYSRGW